jgi:hypothetical protein
MKEQQCLNCGNFNLLSRHTCEYCGSTNLKVVPCQIVDDEKKRAVIMPLAEFVAQADEFAELGPAFLQCGKITKFISDGVELCGKPMHHEGEC